MELNVGDSNRSDYSSFFEDIGSEILYIDENDAQRFNQSGIIICHDCCSTYEELPKPVDS